MMAHHQRAEPSSVITAGAHQNWAANAHVLLLGDIISHNSINKNKKGVLIMSETPIHIKIRQLLPLNARLPPPKE